MIVLDANAAVAMAQGGEAGQALRMLVGNGEAIIAPRCFVTEMGNVAWKYIRIGLHNFIRHRVAEEEGIELFQNALDLIDGYADDESLLLEALHEAARNNHPVYDMLYLVLARRNAATLFTFDKKLRAICEANGVNCLGAAGL